MNYDPNHFFGDPAEKDEPAAPVAEILGGVMFVIMIGWIMAVLHFLPYSLICKG